MPSPIRPWSLWVSFGLLVACGTSASSTTAPDSATLIAIDPVDFPQPSDSASAGSAGASATDSGAAGSSAADASSAGASATDSGAAGSSAADAGSAGASATDPGAAGSSAAGASPSAPMAVSDPGGCGRAGEGSYVAELVDVSGLVMKDFGPATAQAVAVQVSPPTACNRAIAFSRAIPDRQYIVRVKIYAELDGDASTIDVCTIAGTSITVPKVNGSCSATLSEASTLAQPIATLTCYGWRNSDRPNGVVESSAGSESAPHDFAGNAGSASAGAGAIVATRCDSSTQGCPGIAIQYRTMSLRYCVETKA